MLQSLDPHSSYLSSDDYSEMRVKTKGTFEGLGDLFEGHYKESDSTETAITHISSGDIHYLNLGNITGYKSFIALAWVADSQGMPIEIARFEKN